MRPIYLLSPKSYEGTLPLPMITFERLADRIDFSDRDTLLFTSKQAVAFADTIDPMWRTYPSLAVGKATAEAIEKHGGRVAYIPEKFYGETLAKDILERFASRKLLYLRPKEVSFDAATFLRNAGIDIAEQIIYETRCRRYSKDRQPPRDSIIVFTSPSTIRCFLRNFRWDTSYTAIVIGKATLAHLPDNAHAYVADHALIESCVQKAQEIALT